MRKTLLALLLQVIFLSAFAQKTAAPKTNKPSKKETMDWLASKMKEYLAAPRQFVSYNNGVFVYKKETKVGIYCTSTVDLNKLTGMSNEYSSDFHVSGKILTHSVCPGEEYGTDYDNISISGPNFNDYSVPFNFKTDNILVERLRKAFTTLMEYNTAKKSEGEAF